MAEEESTNDPQFLSLLQLGWDVAVFVVRPIGIAIGTVIYYIAFIVFFVLRLFWLPLQFILLPVFYLADFILRCVIAPFRFLAKFETLYIYLGIAALVGVSGGIIISLISGGLQHLLRLDSKAAPKGRTVKDYRKAKRKQDAMSDVSPVSAREDSFLLSTGKKSSKGRGKASKAGKPPTILEELDSDY